MDATDIDLLNTRQLLALPPPRWLIKDVLPEGDYSVLWGPSGQGKSFIALDWAVCLATGRPWQGVYPTLMGPVVYIAAEGGRGIQKRVRALMTTYGLGDVPGLYFLIKPLYVREEGVIEAFLDELATQDIWPNLVIVDTLSRSFGGGEENASADMGEFIDTVTRMAADRFMTALVIHHSNATGARERGHTSLKCGANAMLQCRAEKDTQDRLTGVFLSNDKQKDDETAQMIYLAVEPVASSLVLKLAPTPEKAKKDRGPHVLTPMRKADMLTVLAAAEDGYTFAEWRLATGIPRRTFARRVAQLIQDGELIKDDGRYSAMPAVLDLAELDRNDDD